MPRTASAPKEPGDAILVKRVCERGDTNRTRVAGSRDEVERVVASILNLQRNGAVGFIGWLGPWVSPIVLSYLPQCECKQRQTKRKYEYSYDRLSALKKSILEQRHKY